MFQNRVQEFREVIMNPRARILYACMAYAYILAAVGVQKEAVSIALALGYLSLAFVE
jgi:hypothetical protein